eukprot:759653-Hanusia_phi.AAC.2
MEQEVRALNDQFFRWASRQHSSSSDKLWDSGLRDYLRFAEKLRSDFSDVLAGAGHDSVLEGGAGTRRGRDGGPDSDAAAHARSARVAGAPGSSPVKLTCGRSRAEECTRSRCVREEPFTAGA